MKMRAGGLGGKRGVSGGFRTFYEEERIKKS